MAAYKYDIFLSYAVEDKIELANELCQKLEQKGLKVWYAGRELIPGNSIEKTIRKGLERSEYGIVLITHTYFEKKWTLKELYTLMSREDDNKKIIIPVFHKVTPDEVAIHDKLLSERWALSTSLGLEELSDKILRRVRARDEASDSGKTVGINRKLAWTSGIILVLLLAIFFYWINQDKVINSSSFKSAIENRIDELKKDVEEDLEIMINQENAQVSSTQSVVQTGKHFNSLEIQYRNLYEFSNGYSDYQFQKNVQPASGFDFDSQMPINNYGFDYPNIYLIDKKPTKPYLNKKFIYFNTQPVTFEIGEIEDQDSLAYVSVTYQQFLRLFNVHFEYTASTSERKHTSYTLKGLKPTEVYLFKKDSKGWSLSNIQ